MVFVYVEIHSIFVVTSRLVDGQCHSVVAYVDVYFETFFKVSYLIERKTLILFCIFGDFPVQFFVKLDPSVKQCFCVCFQMIIQVSTVNGETTKGTQMVS
jgi:hypothetical protein